MLADGKSLLSKEMPVLLSPKLSAPRRILPHSPFDILVEKFNTSNFAICWQLTCILWETVETEIEVKLLSEVGGGK